MRKILSILFCLASLISYSQNVKLVTNKGVITNPAYFNVKDFGAVGDSATDDRAAIMRARDSAYAAGGAGVLFFPATTKGYRISDSIVFTQSIRLQGVVNSGGLVNNISAALGDRFAPQQYASTIYGGANKIIFVADTASNGSKPVVAFEYLSFKGDSTGTATAGAFIKVKGNLQDASITNCTFYGGYIQVWLEAAFYPHIQHCHFSAPTLYCVLLDNTIRPDTGDGSIEDCTFSSGAFATTTAIAVYWKAGGGRRITNCKFDASSFVKGNQFMWDISGDNIRAATSDWIIASNSFENSQAGSIRFGFSNPFTNLQIVNNQFAPEGNTSSIIDISGANGVVVDAYTLSGVANAVTAFSFSSCNRVSLGDGTNINNSNLYAFVGCTLTSVIRGDEISITGAASVNGNIVANSSSLDRFVYNGNAGGTIGMLAGSTPVALAANGPNMVLRGNTYTLSANQRGNIYFIAGNPTTPVAAEGTINFLTGADLSRMIITNGGSVGIGGTPNASAIFDVASTTKGMLIPRLTTTQQNAVSSPASGLIIYNTDSLKLFFYNGSAWAAVSSGGGGAGDVTTTGTQTLTNKRITPRYGTTTSSATPTINTDNVDTYELTAQAADITSFTTNLSGTPTADQVLHIIITGTAARAITWGASFEASTIPLPATTVTTTRLDVYFVWNVVTSKWRCGGAW